LGRFTNEPPLEENDDLFDFESKENELKKILYDAPIDYLMTKDKVFDPVIHEKNISSTYASNVNPLFDEVLEDIESKAYYDSNLDELDLLVTLLFDSNEDECFDPGSSVDEINAFDIPLDFEDG
nr:hypothetical protein [Tanacetum cinerariifolium]